ncbi:hypothetical protein D3C75_1197890 [compost metagenome]
MHRGGLADRQQAQGGEEEQTDGKQRQAAQHLQAGTVDLEHAQAVARQLPGGEQQALRQVAHPEDHQHAVERGEVLRQAVQRGEGEHGGAGQQDALERAGYGHPGEGLLVR